MNHLLLWKKAQIALIYPFLHADLLKTVALILLPSVEVIVALTKS